MYDLYATVGVYHRPWLGKFWFQLGPFCAHWGFGIRCTMVVVCVKLTHRRFHKLSLSTVLKFNWRIVTCSMMRSPNGGGQTKRLMGGVIPDLENNKNKKKRPQARRLGEQEKERMRYYAVPCCSTASLQHNNRESSVYIGALWSIVNLITKDLRWKIRKTAAELCSQEWTIKFLHIPR